MKKCLKCGVEYQDSDIFCPVCGERLAATNVCQRCGRPVTAEEMYCRHCGYKIEKEIKCEQCGSVMEEGAKFCQQCGAKVENPIVTVKQRPVKSRGAAATGCTMNPLLKKIFFYVFGGALLLFLSLMLIGCFGDIAKVNGSGSVLALLPSEKLGVSYFFSDAFKSIKQASQYDDKGLAIFLTFQYIFELILWLSAIAFFTIGIVFGTINLAKGAKSEYNLKTKPFVYGLLGGLPYLFIFALETRLFIKYTSTASSYYYSSSTTSYVVEGVFGWGTQMITVCTILGVITLVAYNILTAIFSKKDIVKQSIRGGVAISLTIALLASIGLAIYTSMKDGPNSMSFISPYFLYVNELANSCSSQEPLEGYAALSLLSYILIMFAYVFVQVVINNVLNEQKSIAPIIVNSSIAVFLMITGHAIGVEAFKQSIDTPSSGSSSNYTVLAGAGCVVIIIFVILAAAGYIVSTKIGQKKQEPQTQQ